jgi:prophage regulatory protein
MDIEIAALLGDVRDDRMLRLPEVMRRMSVSRPTIYRMIQKGEFPKPARFGRSSMWPESDIRDYQRKIVQARNDS